MWARTKGRKVSNSILFSSDSKQTKCKGENMETIKKPYKNSFIAHWGISSNKWEGQQIYVDATSLQRFNQTSGNRKGRNLVRVW
jgi:hypothetical protein